MKYDPNGEGNNPNEFDAMPEADRACLLLWIELAMQPAKQLRKKDDSYTLKHDFEHEGGFYVTNGEFKGAMLKAGYEPADSNTMNWQFKVKPRCRPLHWTQKYYQGMYRRDFALAHLTPEQQGHYSQVRAETTYGEHYYGHDQYPWLKVKKSFQAFV